MPYRPMWIACSKTAPIDEGYWSAPFRRWAGEGGLDAYDTGLALSLALPENVAAVGARSLGAPMDVSRHAGSILAAFAIGALLVYIRSAGRWILLGLLLSPPVWGHLATDLGEGPALALTLWWGFAIARGHWAAAGALAVTCVFQKAFGLALGVGTLIGVFCEPRRGRCFGAAAAGGLAAVVGCATLAWGVFGDSPALFLVRPWTTTADVGPHNSIGAVFEHAIHIGRYGIGPHVLPLLAGVALVAPWSRPRASHFSAIAAGAIFVGLFGGPWRTVPLLGLLVVPALDPEALRRRPSLNGGLLSAYLCVQVVGGALRIEGFQPARGLVVLLGLAGAGALLFVAWRRLPRAPVAAATTILVLGCLAGAAYAAHAQRLCSQSLSALAQQVADRVPRDEPLIGAPVLGTRFPGLIYYQGFEAQWGLELASSRPPRIWRVRSPGDPDAGIPFGYVRDSSESLGTLPYNSKSTPVNVQLECYCLMDDYSDAPAAGRSPRTTAEVNQRGAKRISSVLPP